MFSPMKDMLGACPIYLRIRWRWFIHFNSKHGKSYHFLFSPIRGDICCLFGTKVITLSYKKVKWSLLRRQWPMGDYSLGFEWMLQTACLLLGCVWVVRPSWSSTAKNKSWVCSSVCVCVCVCLCVLSTNFKILWNGVSSFFHRFAHEICLHRFSRV